MNEWTEICASPAETARLAARLAPALAAGNVVRLHGNLGAGKTTFVQALARALGVTRPVTSPTFALVQEYPLPDGGIFAHLDLYRMAEGTLLEDIGFDDLLERRAIIAVEWPERAGDVFPPGTIDIRLERDLNRLEDSEVRLIAVRGIPQDEEKANGALQS